MHTRHNQVVVAYHHEYIENSLVGAFTQCWYMCCESFLLNFTSREASVTASDYPTWSFSTRNCKSFNYRSTNKPTNNQFKPRVDWFEEQFIRFLEVFHRQDSYTSFALGNLRSQEKKGRQKWWANSEEYNSKMTTDELVGISNLPNQIYKLISKQGGAFTLLTCGESGLGKTTFINTLFQTTLKASDSQTGRSVQGLSLIHI